MRHLHNIGLYFIMINKMFHKPTKWSVMKQLILKDIEDLVINSLGIMILLILRKNNFIKKTNSPFYFLTLGIIFFSFSLYAISLTNVFLSSEHWIKTLMIPVTPLGGSLIILGWVLTVLKINK